MENRATLKAMNRTVLVFVTILVGLFILLRILDSGSDYQAEKDLWKVHQEFEELARDPEYVPEASFDELISRYQQYIRTYHGSALEPQAHIYLARTHMLKNDFKTAREVLEGLVVGYKDEVPIAIEAIAEIGRSYARQEDYLNIEKTYRRIIREYELTDLGLMAPLTIVDLYSSQGQAKMAKEALDKAIAHYETLIEKNKGQEAVEFRARSLLARAFVARKNWEDAMDTYEDILVEYASSNQLTPQAAESLIKSINTLAVSKLNDFKRPIKLYTKFIKDHPGHPYNSTLRGIINSLEAIKQVGEPVQEIEEVEPVVGNVEGSAEGSIEKSVQESVEGDV